MENVFRVEPMEARVLGVLLEKSLSTPEQYPLSLNALVAGCNQKVNRDPVLTLAEEDVWTALRGLTQKHLVESEVVPGGRVEKYRHKATKMMSLVNPELALLAELLLRGPQTLGELRARASRMAPIDSMDDLARLLDQMAARGFVRRLPPSPGSRAERWVQLVCPDLHDTEAAPAAERAESRGLAARVEALEQEVVELRRELSELRQRLGEGGTP